MLKIKDNVDLKELEKFGAKAYNNGKEYAISDYHNSDAELVIDKNSIDINIYANHDFPNLEFCIDKLYKLIKTDFVEEVSNEKI